MLALATRIAPVTAPAGTVAVMLVLLTTLNVVADTPPNFTDVAPVKPVPVILTVEPTAPIVGVKEVKFT